MTYLELEKVSKSYGEKILFDQIDLHINKGQKAGLVARNGSGKSTLLRVAAGVDLPEGVHAAVRRHPEAKLLFLEQDTLFPVGITVRDALLRSGNPVLALIGKYHDRMAADPADPRLQELIHQMDEQDGWSREARMWEVAGKLRLPDMGTVMDRLSGGERKRVALAAVILSEPDFLILDEPTNHLDVDMIEWLEQYLSQPGLTLLIVTHDRYFLENVCDTILELDRGALYKYKGNYADFLEKKTTREETSNAEMGKLKRLLQRELEWVRRSPSARGTKAKSRVDRFYEIKEEASKPGPDKALKIELQGSRLGGKILEAQYITKKFADRLVVDHFHYNFRKGERVGIVGPNGCGKSTFLNLLTGDLRPDSGKIITGGTVVFGYYTQAGLDISQNKRVIDVIQDIAEYVPLDNGMKLSAAQLLERFLFPRPQQQVYVSQLSGGEKRRLYLLTVLMRNPNVLILDEPTNDLDILTLNVLEDYLMEFPGVVLIVTHDRYFMDKLVDHLFIFEGEGKIRDYNGTYTEYRAWLKEQRADEKQASSAQKSEAATKKPRTAHPHQKTLNRLEKDIATKETRKQEIHRIFAEENPPPDQVNKLSAELRTLLDAIATLELEWMTLVEETE